MCSVTSSATPTQPTLGATSKILSAPLKEFRPSENSRDKMYNAKMLLKYPSLKRLPFFHGALPYYRLATPRSAIQEKMGAASELVAPEKCSRPLHQFKFCACLWFWAFIHA